MDRSIPGVTYAEWMVCNGWVGGLIDVPADGYSVCLFVCWFGLIYYGWVPCIWWGMQGTPVTFYVSFIILYQAGIYLISASNSSYFLWASFLDVNQRYFVLT